MSMRREEAEAVLRITGEDGATKLQQEVNANLDAMRGKTDKVNAATKQSREEAKRLKEEAKGLGGEWDKLTGSIRDSANALGILAAIDIAQMIGSGIASAAAAVRDGAKLMAQEADFGRRFGDGEAALNGLRRAALGMASDGALREVANQAQRAGLTLAQTQAILDAAARAAAATGRDTAEVAGGLVKAVATGEGEVLKTLGLTTKLSDAQAQYASRLGVTTADLTEQQRTLASYEATVASVDKAFEKATGADAVSRVARFDASWENFKATLKGFSVEAFDAAAGIGSLVPIVADALGGGASKARSQMDEAAAAAAALGAEWDRAGTTGVERMAQLARVSIGGTEAAKALTAEIKAQNDAYQLAAERMQAVDAAARKRINALAAEVAASIDAKRTAIEHNASLAHTAEIMGATLEAHGYWEKALRAADAAHVDLASNVRLLTAAIRGSNDEMAQSLLLQAELADAAGDTAGAGALRAQAAGRALGETGSGAPKDAPATRRGGGGGGRREKTDPLKRYAEEAAAMRALEAQLRADGEAFADEMRRQMDDRATAVLREQVETALAARAEQERMLLESRAAGFDSLASSVIGLRDAFGELDGINLDGLAAAAGGMDDLAGKFQAIGAAAEAGGQGTAQAAAGAVAASGQMVAGIIKDQRAQAVIMALVEQAQAWGAFALGNYVGFGAHMASSAIWGTVAGTSKGGGGGGGGGGARGGSRQAAPRMPGGSEGRRDEPRSAPITVHVSGGTYLGTRSTDTGRDLGRMISSEAARSTRADGRANAPA